MLCVLLKIIRSVKGSKSWVERLDWGGFFLFDLFSPFLWWGQVLVHSHLSDQSFVVLCFDSEVLFLLLGLLCLFLCIQAFVVFEVNLNLLLFYLLVVISWVLVWSCLHFLYFCFIKDPIFIRVIHKITLYHMQNSKKNKYQIKIRLSDFALIHP